MSAEKKKLLIVSDSPTIHSGLARCSRELAFQFQDKYEVAVAGWHHYPVRHDYPFFIYCLRKGTGEEARQLEFALKDFNPDIMLLIGDLWDFSYLKGYKDGWPNIKTVAWWTVDGEYTNLSWGEIARAFDRVSTFSFFGKEMLKMYLPEKDISVIYPGINTNTFKPVQSTYASSSDLIDLANRFVVLVVSQNTDRKNIPLTIETFKKFSEGKRDKVLLFILSNPADVLGYDLWALVRRANLGEIALITKDTSVRKGISDLQLSKIMDLSTVLVNTSIGEGGPPFPVLEAMATHTIPITTNYASSPEYIQDKRGFLIDIAEYFWGVYTIRRAIASGDSLLQHLELLYKDWSTDKKIISEYNKNGREFAEQLTWKKTADELDALITESYVPHKREWIKTRLQLTELSTVMVIPTWGKNCGIAEYTRNLIHSLEDQGQKMSICPSNDMKNIIQFTKESNFNVCHIQHEFSFFQDRFALEQGLKDLKSLGVKVIVTLHSWSPHRAYNKMLIENVDTILVHCDQFKQNLMKDELYDNVKVIPMGTYGKHIVDNVNSIKINLGLTAKTPIIGSFGFMREQKGYKEVAYAIRALRNQHPNIHFLLVAPKHEFESASFNEDFFKFLETEKMQDHTLIIREFMPERRMLDVLSCVDLFVLNYKSSPAGGGISAAIKTLFRVQKPIIVSDTMYFWDLKNEVYKEQLKDYNSIVQSITNVLNDEKLQNTLVEESNKYLEIADWSAVAQQHLSIYME